MKILLEMPKRNIYKECCEEIVKICNLFPNWSLKDFIKEERLDVTNGPSFYFSLQEYRQALELDNHVLCSNEELDKIINDGLHIQSLLIQEQYGEEE